MAQSKPPKSSDKTPPPTPETFDEKLIRELIPWRVELLGGLVAFLSLLTLLTLMGINSPNWLTLWAQYMRSLFGWGTFLLLLSTAATGFHFMLNRFEKPYTLHVAQIIGFEVILLAVLPLLHQITAVSRVEALQGRGGGLIGWALAEPFVDFFGPFLTVTFYLLLILWGTALIIQLSLDDVQTGLRTLSQQLGQWGTAVAPAEAETAPVVETAVLPDPPAPPDGEPPAIVTVEQPISHLENSQPPRRSRKLPPLNLLKENKIIGISDQEVDSKKQIIEQTLRDFGLPAEVTQVLKGPAVTQFGLLPGYVERTGPDGETKLAKVRVNQIAALQRDLALALAVQRLRVQAPVPGKGVVGIEVPNATVSMVRLKSIVRSLDYQAIRSPLAVALGQDVAGSPVAVDLGRLPHLLIAGTTGSGKSACINAIISCLVFNNLPEQLNLVMIDPKKVELVRFNGLPHLIGEVEVEADRAVGVLRWLTAEMDRRYELFAKVNARNLNGYNRRAAGDELLRKLPYIVVLIDELADLMHTYPGDVERTLCRLAQMARATGIHLVVATQRPSTDVITGLIKANFPARLSFAVASSTDSRVILDSVGAEQLLGKGDGLFLSPEASGPLRYQGIFIDDEEIDRIVEFWVAHLPDDWEPIPCPWDSLIAKHALLDETDALLEAAIELAQKQTFLSTSFLQRRLRIGYPRAARIMEHLYEMGLVEDPRKGGKTRKTTIDEDEDDPMKRIISEWKDSE